MYKYKINSSKISKSSAYSLCSLMQKIIVIPILHKLTLPIHSADNVIVFLFVYKLWIIEKQSILQFCILFKSTYINTLVYLQFC